MLDKHYKVEFHGYVRQVELFNDEELVVYDEAYLSKYDNYSKLGNKTLQCIRLSHILDFEKDVKSICEIGYGNGTFLKTASKFIDNIYGYDPVNKDVDGLIKINPEQYENYEFDVVTFFDSLEHIDTNIYEYLRRFNTKMFCISVPWYHANAGTEWFMKWEHRRPNEHLHHFDAHGLTTILTNLGYKILSVSNIEDQIRISSDGYPNILTVIAKRE